MKKFKTAIIIFFLPVCVLILFIATTYDRAFTYVQAHFNKTENFVTKVVTVKDMSVILSEQTELGNTLQKEDHTYWMGDEVLSGISSIIPHHLFLTLDHPEYEKLEITFPTTTYQLNGEIIEFLSGEGTITKTYSKGEWKEYK
ncbi:hypothetical protein [Priestia taiwanensis]|uniref:Uncharacterized protein n=1 Tax=Priestia taiwanensis TaxID=1347902 RepID=A0A917AS39_9BACI|nr:hypothetical protein [Priestia taiwanensis]MBM7364048.1 hypothetical protein [Priestia taiwanensis]GGE71200.1 hypothetical protein GCM10007140_21380 [Priestia taiwanensis]